MPLSAHVSPTVVDGPALPLTAARLRAPRPHAARRPGCRHTSRIVAKRVIPQHVPIVAERVPTTHQHHRSFALLTSTTREYPPDPVRSALSPSCARSPG